MAVTFDLIVPVIPLLNSTFTFITFDVPFTFTIPSYADLRELYKRLADKDSTSKQLDHFLEQERKNSERRLVYSYITSAFEKLVF